MMGYVGLPLEERTTGSGWESMISSFLALAFKPGERASEGRAPALILAGPGHFTCPPEHRKMRGGFPKSPPFFLFWAFFVDSSRVSMFD